MTPHLLCIGGEDHALRIPFLLALRHRGFRVTAAATANPQPFAHAGIDYRPIHFDRFTAPFSDWSAIKTLAEVIADVRPRIVQSFDTKPNLLVPLAARSVPGTLAVRTINGLAYLYSSRSPKALAFRAVSRMLHRLAARSTAATVFQNRDDQEFFQRHHMIGAGACRLIRGSGVDVEGFDRAIARAPRPAQLREEFGLGSSEIVVTVTRLTRQKGIPTLLDAAALIHQVRPHVRFLLVGPRESEGPLAVARTELDRHAPYVLAVGPRSDVPALLGLADVFAFPTAYREGVPRALLEAATAGLPIVTTRMPGCTDVILDGWNGFLVPTRSPRLLADRILEMLQDREAAQAMGKRAAEMVRQEFNLEITVTRYVALYEELMNRCVRSHVWIPKETWASSRYATCSPALQAEREARAGTGS